MVLKNLYDRIYESREEFDSNVGSRFHTTYQCCYDDDGKLELRKKGTIDVYNEIQSHADSVDINVILQRFNNGDLSVLDNAKGYYLDLTQFPSTYAEMIQRLQDAENYFNGLPVDVREQYNFSFQQFLAAEPVVQNVDTDVKDNKMEVNIHEPESGES